MAKLPHYPGGARGKFSRSACARPHAAADTTPSLGSSARWTDTPATRERGDRAVQRAVPPRRSQGRSSARSRRSSRRKRTTTGSSHPPPSRPLTWYDVERPNETISRRMLQPCRPWLESQQRTPLAAPHMTFREQQAIHEGRSVKHEGHVEWAEAQRTQIGIRIGMLHGTTPSSPSFHSHDPLVWSLPAWRIASTHWIVEPQCMYFCDGHWPGFSVVCSRLHADNCSRASAE
mgnify:CR=1 FL=1